MWALPSDAVFRTFDPNALAGPKAERCSERPACRPSDYYPVTEPCMNGTTRTTYKKVQPAVCREDLPGAATLPSPSATRKCPPCNPGMAKDAKGMCVFCPAEHFSQGDVLEITRDNDGKIKLQA
ncbi:hypothetical protein ANCDUO_16366 [Ancylostoma duodenale]|uniref:Elapor1/2 TNF receptor-like domain-containing protein n=1 Tax=Ancylostoma duodenale TaxID=51022 RepID=A0A0C2G3N1_9BILA|nr:hypothetical protein ANCDUO_16366 [Ancylostoma duodenale]